ncbi:MAG: penicillin-binding protein 2 [Candidatus Staskawiczbacteria bacterium RIFCSPHIGHO2_02_FULL_34_10]|uniref:Penicillin-binding protein 2 n=1 Tax=Candidatus Staskawiczbacteria bacterium RIFCSPHIGHO2_02_FULL_34_10 TaxID=1802205 RepID=A0A1G2HUY1_9BACT|nr:MAG: penicillin-binding protein 2 [Candidatus Staskawiczbacteria bacterium RIFCSPHIGHO2_02_FULL_34_10]
MLNKRYRIKESINSIETHEVFLDTLAKIEEEKLGLSEKRFEVKIKERVIYVIFGFFLILALILFSKTFYFQILEGKKLYALGENNKGKINLVRAERGIIYDKNLKKLVSNSPAYDLVCDKRSFLASKPEYSKEIQIISNALQKKYTQIESDIIASEESKVVISENIVQEKLLVLEARLNDLPDCQIEKNTIRNYDMGPIFSHILGYMGKISKEDLQNIDNYTASDYIGKVGLERYYEQFLRGIPGRVENIKTATGIKKGDKVLSLEEPGNNLVLNIDADLQSKTYNALEASIKNIGSKKGTAIALNPKTGAILALVSYPAYDNNIFSKGISQTDFSALQSNPYQPFFNRAIAAKYPTGSTIKPFLASGALQENLISPAKLINDPGYILVHSKYDPNVTYKFAGVKPHGLVDMRKALAVSSNIYFYTVGGGYGDQQGLGPSRIKKYLDLYGFEQKTGIDLPGEFGGFVPSPEWKKQIKDESWWDGDTYNLSIGQSDLQVTPLQVAVAYAAIANGGTLYKPQIVQKITSSDQKSILQEFKPEIISQNFIDKQNLQIVREGMRDGVQKDYGSSHMLSNLPVAVAGKTGTAETSKAGIYNTWSVNFAPYDNPEIVFLATIEGVEGLRSATLPVAHDVLQYYFTKK